MSRALRGFAALSVAAVLGAGFLGSPANAEVKESGKGSSTLTDNPTFHQLVSQAVHTEGLAAYGYAVSAKVTETLEGETGEPYLDVRYELGVQNLGTANPKVSFDRIAREYGEIVPENWPYSTMSWGSVATDEPIWDSKTMGWRDINYDLVNPATVRLLQTLGNPDTVHGTAQAIGSTSVLNLPYSVPETNAWAEANGITPWGIVADEAANLADVVSEATVLMNSDGDQEYSVVFNDPFDLVMSRTLNAIVRDNIVIEATRTISFADPGGGPNQVVVQTSRAKELGNQSPLPVIFNEKGSVTSTALGIAAGKQALAASSSKSITLIRQELKKAGVRGKITVPQMIKAARAAQVSDPKWFRPKSGALNSYVNSVNGSISGQGVRLFANIDTGFGLLECSTRVVPSGKNLRITAVSCLPGIPR